MKPNQHNTQTQWAAQFAVASELCKRGYEVAFTSGQNTPFADLMIISPKTKTMFLVDVKGLRKQNSWMVKKKARRRKLFYILAYVPSGEPNRFFIMTQQQATREIQAQLKRLKRSKDYPVPGFLWTTGKKYENQWSALPK